MGDQHRSDTEREEATTTTTTTTTSRARRDKEDAQFDPAHANTQLAYHARGEALTSPMNPAKTVAGVGDDQFERYKAAMTAHQPAGVLAAVRDMSTTSRATVQLDLDELSTFMSARDIITVAGLAQASPDATLLAMLKATPPATVRDIRAYAGDLAYRQIDETFSNAEIVPALRAKFPVSPVELFPQLGEDGVLKNAALLTWLLETTPQRTIARILLDMDSTWVPYQAHGLDALGERGWDWLHAVDANIAAVTKPATLAAYKHHAVQHKTKTDPTDIKDDEHIKQLEGLEKAATADSRRSDAARKAEASSLRARRADVIAKSSPMEIQRQLAHAGFDGAEQLAWILDKPGLTAAQLREVTTVIEGGTYSPETIKKLQKKFPDASPEELFSGGIPPDLVLLGGLDPKVGTWLLRGAAPETILRIVANEPELIDEYCQLLISMKIGFGWVQQLGGYHNDYLLRRFALKVPDAATRKYIEERLLGTGTVDTGTKAAPAESTDAYTSAKQHLDADLARPANDPKSEVRTDAIAADISELKPAEVEALRHDARRLQQILSTASKKTFAQILETVKPELQVVTVFVSKDRIEARDFIAYAATRPAREVTTTLSSSVNVARLQSLVEKLGPFEIFPPLTTADVLGEVLRKNPTVIEWMMASEPSQVLRAFAAHTVIDAAVHALSKLDEISAIEAWPSAEALGPGGRAVLVQLSARAKGQLKEALDEKLKAKLPKHTADDEEVEELEPGDANALTLGGTGGFVTRLEDLIQRNAPASTILALCRQPGSVVELAKADSKLISSLRTSLDLAPDVVFGAPIKQLFAQTSFREWILMHTPALRVLDAIDPTNDQVFASLIEPGSPVVDEFLDRLPRGRGLSQTRKATLHRAAKLIKRDARFEQLFQITFDAPIANLTREEAEKLWSVLELLPHAHVDQKSIARFVGRPNQADDSTAGVYYPDTRAIELQQGRMDSKDAKQYDHGVEMTEAEAIEAVGSKADLDRLVAQTVMTKNADGTYSFKTEENLKGFPHTILHEVGHAVDYMLGAQSELIYGLAGWKRFQASDFDGWAQELGGWDTVTEPDKKQIRQVWISWLSGGGKGTVGEMVDSDHPVHAARYAAVGVVKLASRDIMYAHTAINSRYAMAHHGKQSWLTLSTKGYNAAPSAYALTAPEEYFAECYADYYREFTESPTTATKGGTLVPWIKTWFDTHIDKVGHNPIRHGRGF